MDDDSSGYTYSTDYTTDSYSSGTSDLTWGGYVPTVPGSSPEFAPNWVLTIGSEEPKKEENMRGLYRIIVVNPKTEEIYEPEVLVVAKDREGALLKADLCPEVRKDPDLFDILVEHVGDVRAKKDVQKVKVVKEDEE